MQAWGGGGKCLSERCLFYMNTQETSAMKGYDLLLILLCFFLQCLLEEDFAELEKGAHSCVVLSEWVLAVDSICRF